MENFNYERAATVADAIERIQRPGARFIGGGTNLLDLMKGGVEEATQIIDLTRLPLTQIKIAADGSTMIGALMRNSDTANHPLIRQHYPLLAQALVAGASPQLRNMATIGGNLMQRTRCGYFADAAFSRCNKRVPGSGCGARDGQHNYHAIFGISAACIAVNPSDMNVALAALDAMVTVDSPRGQRSIPIADFHRLPGDSPHLDTNLQADELIVAVELPPSRYAQYSHYLKVRERSSYAFALVAVAAGLDIQAGKVVSARIAAGGVAHKPWRLNAVENALMAAKLSDVDYRLLGDLAVRDAQPLMQNAYKIPMLRAAVGRAVLMAGERA
jgi:xanthine dehydrogenase YagS FAD-binding subunit